MDEHDWQETGYEARRDDTFYECSRCHEQRARRHGPPSKTETPCVEKGTWLILDTRSVVGNCALFWCEGGHGYTCELKKAGLFTEKEARSHRDTDVAVPYEVAKQAVVTHVRLDRLRELYDISAKGARR